jgi:adenylate kinase
LVAAQAQDSPEHVIGVIFGPPGSGKGTQAARLQDDLLLNHMSTGDILRKEAAEGTELGQEAARIMAAGDLVPDELILDIVRARLPEAEQGVGVLLDGFPRTVAQADALDAMLEAKARRVNFVLALDAPEHVLVDRLLHRAEVEGRKDDNREAIGERMGEYRRRTAAVLDRYRRHGTPVHLVDGVGTPDEVFERIRAALGGSVRR